MSAVSPCVSSREGPLREGDIVPASQAGMTAKFFSYFRCFCRHTHTRRTPITPIALATQRESSPLHDAASHILMSQKERSREVFRPRAGVVVANVRVARNRESAAACRLSFSTSLSSSPSCSLYPPSSSAVIATASYSVFLWYAKVLAVIGGGAALLCVAHWCISSASSLQR